MGAPDDLLRPGSLGARLIQLLLVGTQVAFAIPALTGTLSDVAVVAALILFTVGVGLVGRRGPVVLALPTTVAVVLLGVAINVLVEPTLPTSGWPGYDSWNFGATTWLMFFLALRGRTAWAWIGFAGMTVVTLVWVMAVGRPPLDGIDMVIRHAGTLLMGTLFQLLLARSSRAIGQMRRARIVQAANGASAEARVRDGELWARRLETQVKPVLDLIASPARITAKNRVEFALVEVSLRDILRGGDLATPDVLRLAREARLRGATVTLIDDSAGLAPLGDLDQVVEELLASLRGLTGGQLTARILPAERDVFATLVRDGPDGYLRREFVS